MIYIFTLTSTNELQIQCKELKMMNNSTHSITEQFEKLTFNFNFKKKVPSSTNESYSGLKALSLLVNC